MIIKERIKKVKIGVKIFLILFNILFGLIVR